MTLQGEKALEIKETRSKLDDINSTIGAEEKELKELRESMKALKVEVREAEEVETVDEKEQELETNEEEVKSKEERLEELQAEKEQLNKQIKELEKELDELQEVPEYKEEKEGEERNMEDVNIRKEATEAFIRSKGTETREGLVSGDVGVLIPEEVAGLQKDFKTMLDLAQYVTKTKVSTASGKYPILKRATAGLNSVAELEKNPELAKPEFIEVNWEVETYRGAIPISNEALDDAEVDLMGLVAQSAKEQKINTTNKAIVEALAEFEAKEADGVDGIKDIVNVDLDPAYDAKIIASQSFYNEVDKMKDENGRYLLQDSIAFESGKSLLGREVIVVSDTLFGAAGEAKAFIGDIKRAVLFADRKDLEVRWADHDIYGKYLQAVLRFDVKPADTDAGFFVTLGGSGE